MIFLCIQVFIQTVADAHRLNEYLEAATISLAPRLLRLELRLTPGTDVAPKVLEQIDRNGDGRFSVQEQAAYIALLDRDLALFVDNHQTALDPQSFVFPTAAAIRQGTGDISVIYETGFTGHSDMHRLQFQNRFQSATGVYIVNCLLPGNQIHVTRQHRSYDQSVYELDFTTGTAAVASAPWLRRDDHKAVLQTYFLHGINHILTGYDHLLFLAALVLGAASFCELVKVITAFTLAHSLTLTLAVLGFVRLPEIFVEAVISGSIVFVAIQNVYRPLQASGATRLWVAFIFGLFHGLGFAGGLLGMMHQLSKEIIVLAIIGFTIGIEAGNQLVLLPSFGLLSLMHRSYRRKEKQPHDFLFIRRIGSWGIAAAGGGYLCVALLSGL